jgi:hypothetical protein
MIAYLFDDDLRRQSNREGRMFWEAYLEEICTQLGVPPTPVPPAALDREGALASVDGLMVGVQSGGRLSAAALQGIDRWVREGGTLVGFAVEGLDEVFGVRGEGSLPSPEDYAMFGLW